MSYTIRSSVFVLAMMFAASLAVGSRVPAQPGAMRVTGMTPATGHPGTVVTLTGQNFGTQGTKQLSMNLNGVNLMEVRSWSNTQIRAVIPNLPVGEYTVVLYLDSSHRTYAGWATSPRFRIIPRGIGAQPTPLPRPPFPSATCTAVAGATNMLCNPDFDTVGQSGAVTPPVTLPNGGGAGNSAALYWSLFVNGGNPISSELVNSDRPGATSRRLGQPPKMVHVVTNNWATGILQQFLARDHGPQRVTYAVWVKAVRGQVTVSIGNWGLKLEGGWRPAATTTTTGKWEFLSGCSVYDPKKPLPLNQIFIGSAERSVADFYLDFVEVKNADAAWKGVGCTEVP